jgi:hypothetical protein
MSLYTCLETVVGLSRTACACWDTGKPVDFNTSESGLFVSDLVPLQMANSAADCEQGGVWDIMQTARTNAINTFLAELPATLNKNWTPTLTPFLGWAGSNKFNSSLSVLQNGNFVGLRLVPHQIKGGVIILRSVELALEGLAFPAVVNVQVYSNRDPTLVLGTAAVTLTTSGKFYAANFATPVTLDISDKDSAGRTYVDPYLEYYIVYSMPVGGRYVNNTINEGGCNFCMGRNAADVNRLTPYVQYVSLAGVENDTIAGMTTPRNLTQNANGLRLNADYGCQQISWLCDLTFDITAIGAGNHSDFARSIAICLQQKMGEYVADAILKSGNINSMTILSTEAMLGKLQSCRKNYNLALVHIADNMPQDLTDCLACKESMFKINI